MSRPEDVFESVAVLSFFYKALVVIVLACLASCESCAPDNVTTATVTIIRAIKAPAEQP